MNIKKLVIATIICVVLFAFFFFFLEKNPQEMLECSDNYEPVCARDGKSYLNSCYAQNAGQNSYTQGLCSLTDDMKVSLKVSDFLKNEKYRVGGASQVKLNIYNDMNESFSFVIQETSKEYVVNSQLVLSLYENMPLKSLTLVSRSGTITITK